MHYDTRITTTPSDLHGERCPWCQDAPCATNIYLVDADGEDGMAHTCVASACIDQATGPGRHHCDIREALVEISTAPLPWETTTTNAPEVAA
jgi:hypothetical protein